MNPDLVCELGRTIRFPICGFKPAKVLSEARHGQRKAVFFFRSKLTLPEGEGPASRSKL